MDVGSAVVRVFRRAWSLPPTLISLPGHLHHPRFSFANDAIAERRVKCPGEQILLRAHSLCRRVSFRFQPAPSPIPSLLFVTNCSHLMFWQSNALSVDIANGWASPAPTICVSLGRTWLFLTVGKPPSFYGAMASRSEIGCSSMHAAMTLTLIGPTSPL